MNVAPTIDKPPPKKRRGATCDARQRIDTPVNGLIRPQMDWRNQTAAVPHIPACHPGDMNVAPTIDKPPPGDAGAPLVTPVNGLARPQMDWRNGTSKLPRRGEP